METSCENVPMRVAGATRRQSSWAGGEGKAKSKPGLVRLCGRQGSVEASLSSGVHGNGNASRVVDLFLRCRWE